MLVLKQCWVHFWESVESVGLGLGEYRESVGSGLEEYRDSVGSGLGEYCVSRRADPHLSSERELLLQVLDLGLVPENVCMKLLLSLQHTSTSPA